MGNSTERSNRGLPSLNVVGGDVEVEGGEGEGGWRGGGAEGCREVEGGGVEGWSLVSAYTILNSTFILPLWPRGVAALHLFKNFNIRYLGPRAYG